MNDSLLMRDIEGFRRLHRISYGFSQRKGPSGQTIREPLSNEVFKNQIVHAGILTNVVQRADMWMVQRRDGSSFLFQALSPFHVTAQVGWQDFHGHQTIEPGVDGAVHLAHSSSA